ncbi:MAG: hypothetical protein JW959_06420 [Pirellulales bacterium]|nr:hypothetical protein [Pirellulales bacterium]
MNLPSNEIDRVVREVLAELGAAPSGTERPATTAAREDRNGALTLSSSVVSTDELNGRLDSVRRVVVQRRAVVTPSARDELLRRGIALEYADSREQSTRTFRLVMVAADADYNVAPLAAALDREGFGVERSQQDCLMAAVDNLAEAVCGGDALGVLLSSNAAAGLCLANRLPGVRAIGAGNASEVSAAAEAVGANLLVADPKAGSFFQLKRVVAEFARGGVRQCPATFRERLK